MKSIEVCQNIAMRRIPRRLDSTAGESTTSSIRSACSEDDPETEIGIPVTNAKVGLNSRVLPSIGVPEVKRE